MYLEKVWLCFSSFLHVLEDEAAVESVGKICRGWGHFKK
jgi:hypothetical protein